MSEPNHAANVSGSSSVASTPTGLKTTNSNQFSKKKVACVECRQQKSKCDAYKRAPEPCTRCLKKGVPCVLQRDFRRTCKRARNEVIEKKFKELTQSLSNLGSEELLRKLDSDKLVFPDEINFTKDAIREMQQELWSFHNKKKNGSSSDIADNSNRHELLSTKDAVNLVASNGKGLQYSNLDAPIALSEEELKCSPKTLGDITLSSEEIAELFLEFCTKYHPFLPVVDVTKGPERIYSLSPCLFWVMMLIGLRRKFEAIEMMNKLSNMVKSILAEITISPIIRYWPSEQDEPVLNVSSVFSVQAFLLYTYWPPLTSSLSADTSWNTIGSAMFQALRIGLNSAQFSTEYATANSQLIHEQIRTWICCNIVSQTISASFGFPAYVSFDHAVMSSCKMSSFESSNDFVPCSIKQMLQIAHFENQLIVTMNSNPGNMSGLVANEEKLPLLHVLSRQLKELEIQLDDVKLDEKRRFLLLVTKVHLLTYYFTDEPSDITEEESDVSIKDMETNFATKRGLVMAYNAAVELLQHCKKMWKHDPFIVKYLPGVYLLNIWQSACIISKLVHSSLGMIIDVTTGREVYQHAVSLISNASVLKYDMSYRSAGIMRSIWSMFNNMFEEWKIQRPNNMDSIEQEKDFNLKIRIKSRMSVSVFFDCLYLLREKCGMAKLKREKESKAIESEYDNDGIITELAHGKRRLSDGRNLEEDARRIIYTIPLDPEPINAHQSSGSNITSPDSSHSGDVLSLKCILNKTSPRDDSLTSKTKRVLSSNVHSVEGAEENASKFQEKETSALSGSGTRDPLYSMTDSRGVKNNVLTKKSQSPHASNIPSPLVNSNSHANNSPVQVFEDLLSHVVPQSSIKLTKPIKHTKSVKPDEPSEKNLDSVSPITTEQWDNWESDLVWKDVDILMNEFAFNPTL